MKQIEVAEGHSKRAHSLPSQSLYSPSSTPLSLTPLYSLLHSPLTLFPRPPPLPHPSQQSL